MNTETLNYVDVFKKGINLTLMCMILLYSFKNLLRSLDLGVELTTYSLHIFLSMLTLQLLLFSKWLHFSVFCIVYFSSLL